MGEDLKPKEMKMPEIKEHIVHVKTNYKDVLNAAIEFKNDNGSDIVRSTKTEGLVIFYMKDKSIVYIMSEARYRQWCLGRSYTMNGKKYHSGHEVE